MTNEERIKADAQAYVAKTRGQQGRVETYIAGATAENTRAQVLVDVLEDAKWELLDLYRDKGDNGSPLTEKIDMILQKWKGKEVGDE